MSVWVTTAGLCFLPVVFLIGYWIVASILGIED